VLLAQDAPAPHKSVYGKLELVNLPKSGVIMKSDDGERLAWRFDARSSPKWPRSSRALP
jgi:hypothetical protein